jgi:hypothetical protein
VRKGQQAIRISVPSSGEGEEDATRCICFPVLLGILHAIISRNSLAMSIRWLLISEVSREAYCRSKPRTQQHPAQTTLFFVLSFSASSSFLPAVLTGLVARRPSDI